MFGDLDGQGQARWQSQDDPGPQAPVLWFVGTEGLGGGLSQVSSRGPNLLRHKCLFSGKLHEGHVIDAEIQTQGTGPLPTPLPNCQLVFLDFHECLATGLLNYLLLSSSQSILSFAFFFRFTKSESDCVTHLH